MLQVVVYDQLYLFHSLSLSSQKSLTAEGPEEGLE
jgi:hypothetical protein